MGKRIDFNTKRHKELVNMFKAKESILTKQEIRKIVGYKGLQELKSVKTDKNGNFVKDARGRLITEGKPYIELKYTLEKINNKGNKVSVEYYGVTSKYKNETKHIDEKSFTRSNSERHQQIVSRIIDNVDRNIIKTARFNAGEENKEELSYLLRDKKNQEIIEQEKRDVTNRLIQLKEQLATATNDNVIKQLEKQIQSEERQYKLAFKTKIVDDKVCIARSEAYERMESIEKIYNNELKAIQSKKASLMTEANKLDGNQRKLEINRVNAIIERQQISAEAKYISSKQDSEKIFRDKTKGISEAPTRHMKNFISSPDLSFEMSQQEMKNFRDRLEDMKSQAHHKQRHYYEKAIQKMNKEISKGKTISKIYVEAVSSSYSALEIQSHKNFQLIVNEPVLIIPQT